MKTRTTLALSFGHRPWFSPLLFPPDLFADAFQELVEDFLAHAALGELFVHRCEDLGEGHSGVWVLIQRVAVEPMAKQLSGVSGTVDTGAPSALVQAMQIFVGEIRLDPAPPREAAPRFLRFHAAHRLHLTRRARRQATAARRAWLAPEAPTLTASRSERAAQSAPRASCTSAAGRRGSPPRGDALDAVEERSRLRFRSCAVRARRITPFRGRAWCRCWRRSDPLRCRCGGGC
jgi:hypothetical protein